MDRGLIFPNSVGNQAGSTLLPRSITLSLSSPEASLCCGEAGEKEKESAGGTMGPRALSL